MLDRRQLCSLTVDMADPQGIESRSLGNAIVQAVAPVEAVHLADVGRKLDAAKALPSRLNSSVARAAGTMAGVSTPMIRKLCRPKRSRSPVAVAAVLSQRADLSVCRAAR
jgi:hypothetical protein